MKQFSLPFHSKRENDACHAFFHCFVKLSYSFMGAHISVHGEIDTFRTGLLGLQKENKHITVLLCI